jgi:hypothetical protein
MDRPYLFRPPSYYVINGSRGFISLELTEPDEITGKDYKQYRIDLIRAPEATDRQYAYKVISAMRNICDVYLREHSMDA